MTEEQKGRAADGSARAMQSYGPWALSRLEILAAGGANRWPAARVELSHERRGRISEVGTGAGGMDAVFNAIAQMFGVSAPIESLAVRYTADAGPALADVAVDLIAIVDGERFQGSALTCDLLKSCVCAYLDALAKVELTGSRGQVVRPQCSGELGWISNP